jgi:hypothetical protein
MAADTTRVQDRVRVLKQLVRDSLYVVDTDAVAQAIVLRAMLRRTVPEPPSRSEPRGHQVRSFRRDRDARSFRLSRSPHLRAQHH